MKRKSFHRSGMYTVIISAGFFLFAAALTGCRQEPLRNAAGPEAGFVNIAGCYSNLSYNEEGGDLLGYEFFIVHSNAGPYILYQESEGWPNVLFLLPLNVEGREIRFTVPSRELPHGNFIGTVTAGGLSGKFEGTDNRVELKRRESYWSGLGQSLRITGCYSNMYYNEEGGALLGTEFFIVVSKDGHHLLYQESSGEPGVPLLVPVEEKDAVIRFTLPAQGAHPRRFVGTVTPGGLAGEFIDTAERVVLERKASWWQ